MKLGVIGGTFDPIHLGHLAIAEAARRMLKMDEVIFVPAGQPYFKALALITPAEHRVNMLKLALAGRPYFTISRIEIERPGPSYAVDTIDQLRKQLSPENGVFFILGWDSIMTLPRWEAPERLISLCKLVAAPRPGFPKPDISLLEKDLPGITQRAIVMEEPLINISATNIRERIRQGLPIDKMVPEAVEKYIREKGLYRRKS